MTKRICPSCGEVHYSADTMSDYWICRKCGTKIGRDREEPAGGNTK